MERRTLKINHEDERGIIMDILTHREIQHVTLITSKRNAFRGDHYHKESGQYTYVWEGEIRYVSRNRETGKAEAATLGKGDLAYSPPNEEHGFLALKDSTLLILTFGPRGGEDFEKDTYRLSPPESLKTLL